MNAIQDYVYAFSHPIPRYETMQRGPSPRLRCADRDQLIPAMPLEELLPADHQARIVWQFVLGLDLSPLHATIRSVAGRPGRPATDPRILTALWLYAALEGVGSARALDILCTNHHAFRWLCGGVRVYYHVLYEFRVENGGFLDDLLIRSIAALREQNLVDLNLVLEDGQRQRIGAGAHGPMSMKACLTEARQQIERLRGQLDEDLKASKRTQQKALIQAAQQRQARLRQALQRLPGLPPQ